MIRLLMDFHIEKSHKVNPVLVYDKIEIIVISRYEIKMLETMEKMDKKTFWEFMNKVYKI